MEGFIIRRQAGLAFQIAAISGILLIFIIGFSIGKYSLATLILGISIAALPGAMAGILWDEPVKYGPWVVGTQSLVSFFG